MKLISQWASRHVPLAITLITLGEVVNGFNGFMLGATLLDEVRVGTLHVGIAALMGMALGVRWLARSGNPTFSFGRWCLFGAFFGNFLLFGLLGGAMAPRLQPYDGTTGAWGNRRIEYRTNRAVRSDTLRPVEPAASVTGNRASDKQTGKRVAFVLLFALSIVLTGYMTALACSIACAGKGFLALVVLLLGLGVSAGGIYLLGRTTERPIKKLSEMTTGERRRAGRRFWLSWALLIGIVTLLLFIGSIT